MGCKLKLGLRADATRSNSCQQPHSVKAALEPVHEMQSTPGQAGAASSNTWALKQPLLLESFGAASQQGSPPIAHYQGFDLARPAQASQARSGGRQPSMRSAMAQPQSEAEGCGQGLGAVESVDHRRHGSDPRNCTTRHAISHPVRVDIECGVGSRDAPHTCAHCGHGEPSQVRQLPSKASMGLEPSINIAQH